MLGEKERKEVLVGGKEEWREGEAEGNYEQERRIMRPTLPEEECVRKGRGCGIIERER